MFAAGWKSRFRGLLLALLLLLVGPGWAHNEEEDTTLEISVKDTSVTLAYLTKFPSMSSFVRLKQLDSNGDKNYSDAEKQVFLEKRLADYLSQVEVRFDGQPLQLAAPSREAIVSGDPLGLSELTVSYTLVAPLPSRLKAGDTLVIKDPVFGWNRYKIAGDHGGESSVVEASAGDTMTVTFTAGKTATVARQANATSHGDEDKLLALVGSEMTPTVLLTTLGLAFILGALHALTPGHGKTMVAAYLVGSRGTISQAVLLGIVVTITHTASVFLLGIACMVAFQYVVPDKIIPWLGFVSGLMVTGVGATLLIGRLTGKDWGHGHSHDQGHGHSHGHSHGKKAGKDLSSHDHSHSHDHSPGAGDHSHSHGQPEPSPNQASLTDHGAHSHDHHHSHDDDCGHDHSHDHDHDHDHQHTHSSGLSHPRFGIQGGEPVSAPIVRLVSDAPAPSESVSLWALVGLGISGGLVPCPEALVVLLAALSLNKLMLGMLVLVAFSTGLASLLVLIGILVVSATRMSKRFYPSDETIRKVSIVSYVVICGLGLVIAVRSLVGGGVITINL